MTLNKNWQESHATLSAHTHRSIDAARSVHDERNLHETIAAVGLLMSGQGVPQIARTVGLDMDDVMKIIDEAEDALRDAVSGIE